MSFTNVKLIFLRELRDQLRDRRTLFTIVVLPLLLYPLMGMSVFQVQQFLKEHASKVRIVGTDALPEEPALLADGKVAREFASERLAGLLKLDVVPRTRKTLEELRGQAQRDIQLGLCDAVVYFPPDFAERLAKFRLTSPVPSADSEVVTAAASDENANGVPEPEIIYNAASDKSKVARQRIKLVIEDWCDAIGKDNLESRNIPATAARPFVMKETDVAEAGRRRAALWSKVLPFILMVWALTGAFYPAVDLCAGEKERGTLETLLSSPAARSEIVWGKLLTVMTFSMTTALLNLVSMTATGTFIVTQVQKLGAGQLRLDIGPPPMMAMFWLVLALVPISALFGALSLAIAAFARSSKEGQYYLLPLLMICLPLMMLPILPATEMDLGFALIPLSGLMLLLRALIEGQYWEALRFSVPVIGVTAICCSLSIRWAIDQFNNESVLFRESERFGLAPWIRQLVRDRQDTPKFGEALLCGVLLLVIRFFFSLMVPPQTTWSNLATTTLIMLIALIATPACLMAVMLTRRPAKTLLLSPPSFLATIPAAGLLALLLHPTMLWLSEGIRRLYPFSPQAQAQVEKITELFNGAPLWQMLLVIGLAPAICEELAFRGFILSGLRRMGHKWGAIVLAAVIFGLAHGILQQSLGACVVGIVIGYLAVKTGSLWPGVLYHLVHNSLSVLLARLSPDAVAADPILRLLFVSAEGGEQVVYRPAAALVAALLAAGILWWLKSLPYHHSAEERFQEALDNQPSPLVARPVAVR
jgi:sodium transport system permease protein